MNSKPRIAVKDLCTLLGITPTTVRLYERYLHNKRYDVAESGYRQFDAASLFQLFDLRFMAKSGLSVKEAAEVCQSPDLGNKYKSLLQCEHLAVQQQEYYTALVQALNEARTLLEKVESLDGSFECVERPAFWYLECEEEGSILKGSSDQLIVKEWVKRAPLTHMVTRVECDDPDRNAWSYRLGLGAPEYGSSLVDLNSARVRFVAAEPCLVTIVRDEGSESARSSDYSFVRKVINKGLTYMRQEGLELKGDIFTRLVTTNAYDTKHPGIEDRPCDYYYASFPIA